MARNGDTAALDVPAGLRALRADTAAAVCDATASRAASSAANTASVGRAAFAAPAAAAALAVDRAVKAPDEALVGGNAVKGAALDPKDGTLVLAAKLLPAAGDAGAAPTASRFSRPSLATELTHPSGTPSASRATRALLVPSSSSLRSITITRVLGARLPASSLSSSRPDRIFSFPVATSTSPCEIATDAVLEGEARGVAPAVTGVRGVVPSGEAARGVAVVARGVALNAVARGVGEDVMELRRAVPGCSDRAVLGVCSARPVAKGACSVCCVDFLRAVAIDASGIGSGGAMVGTGSFAAGSALLIDFLRPVDDTESIDAPTGAALERAVSLAAPMTTASSAASDARLLRPVACGDSVGGTSATGSGGMASSGATTVDQGTSD